MIQTSEFTSIGHPDKVADYISSYLLDYCLKRDPATRFAVECQIKDNFVTLGGEVTTRATLDSYNVHLLVKEAVERIGYTARYRDVWGADNCISPDNLTVVSHIGLQSPDIALGVDHDGWGDQGIFWGMATRDAEYGYMPRDHYLAKKIGQELYRLSKRNALRIGLDIKTQVEVTDGHVSGVIVAAPMQDDLTADEVREIAWQLVSEPQGDFALPPTDILVNGTGRYVRHASQGDCGTTGRKLAVDFYGGNCRIGGGSPWTKDPSKADLTLNVYARQLALQYALAHAETSTVYVAISCCIGLRAIRITYFDGQMNQLDTRIEERPARDVIDALGLRNPIYAELCEYGLFSRVDAHTLANV